MQSRCAAALGQLTAHLRFPDLLALQKPCCRPVILLQDRQFAVASELGARVNAGNPWALQWLDHVQAALAAHGPPSAEAHAGALAELARLLERQALVLACEQLYLGLAVLALVTAAAVALQRQLR